MVAFVAVSLIVTSLAVARDDKPTHDKDAKKSEAAKSPKPPTHKVDKAPFRVDLSLKGTFETPAMTEVSVNFEAWAAPMAPQPVLSAVEPGTRVKKGDVLVRLDPDRIDKMIRDMESDQMLADLSLRQLETEVGALEKSAPLDLAAADRMKRLSDEDAKRFEEIDRPFAEESAKRSNKMMHQQLEYAMEELKQLEKMYRSKDLTEETEEIILKRQRNEVDYYKFIVKQSDVRKDQFFGFDLPRRIERVKEEVIRANLAWEKAKITLPMQLQKSRLALDKAKYERARATERLANLKADRQLFTIKSPADGIVYYGRCSQGNFSNAAALLNRLQKGGNILAEEVFMTIVQPRPLFVRATADEKEYPQIAVGAPTKIIPNSLPDTKLDGQIEKVTLTPISPGTFEVRSTVEVGDAKVFPGMGCTVKVTPYLRESVIAVPSSSVFADELNDDRLHVYVWRADASKFQKRSVTVGKKSGGKTEIIDGLKVGDEIAVTKPEAKDVKE
jgi:multidrug efflux pump subunit AcrA (membrane-fusion protein)